MNISKNILRAFFVTVFFIFMGLVKVESAQAACNPATSCNTFTQISVGESFPQDYCTWAECGMCPAGTDACQNLGAYQCVNNAFVSRCDKYSNSCSGGYWHAVAWPGDALFTEVCTNGNTTPGVTPGVTGTPGGGTGGGPISCTDPGLTPTDTCWKFTCPDGCNADGGNTCTLNRVTGDCGSLTLAENECGQIDVVSSSGQYCQVTDINCSCPKKSPTPTPTKPKVTPTPTKVVTSPTPTPPTITDTPVGPACNSIALTDLQGVELTGNADASFVPDETSVKFRCGATKPAMVDHYEFKITSPSGEVTEILASNGTLSDESYLIQEYGYYTAQCRVCTVDGCLPYESLLIR